MKKPYRKITSLPLMHPTFLHLDLIMSIVGDLNRKIKYTVGDRLMLYSLELVDIMYKLCKDLLEADAFDDLLYEYRTNLGKIKILIKLCADHRYVPIKQVSRLALLWLDLGKILSQLDPFGLELATVIQDTEEVSK